MMSSAGRWHVALTSYRTPSAAVLVPSSLARAARLIVDVNQLRSPPGRFLPMAPCRTATKRDGVAPTPRAEHNLCVGHIVFGNIEDVPRLKREADSAGFPEAGEIELHSRALLALSMIAMEGAGLELRPVALRAVLAISEVEPCSLGDFAWHLRLSPSATSRLVETLVGLDLIDRRSAADDRRRVTLTSTSAGRRVVARLVSRRRSKLTRVLRAMSSEGRAELRSGLAEFAAVSADLRARAGEQGGSCPVRAEQTAAGGREQGAARHDHSAAESG
jgi:DNA-binding MarR family transcriptional regulator